MNFADKLLRRLRSLITQPTTELTRAQRWVRYAMQLTYHCARELRRDNATQMAAALTYRTLFSLLPMLVLAMAIFQAFRGMESYQATFKQSVVSFIMPQTLLEADAQTGKVLTEEELDEARAAIGNNIQEWLDKLGSVDFGKITWVGLLVFIYAATTLLETIERSFNRVVKAERGRAWYLRLTFYYTMVTLGPLVLVTGQVLQRQFMGFIETGSLTNWLNRPMVILSPLMTSWLVLLALYVLLPCANVKIRYASIGALVSAGLWVLSKELFAVYVSRTGVTTLYGALGLVPLFLMWIYLTWLIVLFGLELTYTLQALEGRVFEKQAQRAYQRPVCDSDYIIPLAAMIGQAFAAGRTCSLNDLNDEMNLPPRQIDHLLKALLEQGYIHRVEETDRYKSGGYTMALPPEQVRIADLLALGRSLGISDQHGSTAKKAWNQIDELAKSRQQAAGDRTLRDVIG